MVKAWTVAARVAVVLALCVGVFLGAYWRAAQDCRAAVKAERERAAAAVEAERERAAAAFEQYVAFADDQLKRCQAARLRYFNLWIGCD